MRSIKFRAIPKTKPEEKTVFEITLEDAMSGRIVSSQPELFHFLSFTGLTDSKGKEIYEGDIVRMRRNNLVVRWENNKSRFELSSSFEERIGYVSLTKAIAYVCEVVGNVYV